MFVNEFAEIRNDEEYEAALAHVEKHMDVALTEAEGNEFGSLVDLVERYEDEKWPMGYPTLAATIEFHMEQFDLTLEDLALVIGSVEQAVEVLAGNLKISAEMGAALSKQFEIIIPPEYEFRP